MAKWTPTGDYGIRYREHNSRTTGVGKRKRPLRYFVAVHKWKGKTVTDTYGWEGDDFKNYDDVVETAVLLRQNRRKKVPPYNLRVLLEEREQLHQAIETAKAEEERQQRIAEERELTTKLDYVFDQYCESSSHKKSLKDEKGLYKNWIQPAIGQKKLDEVILLDLERIRKKMEKAGKAVRSIQYVKAVVRQLYNYASIRDIYKGESPTLHFMKKQKLDNKRQRYLSPNEANALLEYIRPRSKQTHNMSLLSLNAGMRFGEIASLKWQHINTTARSILIVDPKNGESRSAYMTNETLAMFQEMEEGKPEELVFPAQTGEKMAAASKTFFRAVDALGLNNGITDRRMKVVFHTLRHSCASWLVNAGVEIPTIAKILGHKSLEMTARYSHVNDTSVKNAMQTLDHQQQQLNKVIEINSKQ